MLLKASKTTLFFLLCFGFAISSGCKSMELGKPKLPTLPSLAFWKKGEDSEIPPPPARHFDPSRFGEGAETQVAQQVKTHQAQFDKYGMRISDSAAKETSNLAASGFKFKEESLEKLNSKPIRKPYGLDDLGGDEMLAKAENKFNLDSANLKNKFEKSIETPSSQLSSAQQDFRSAMSSANDLKATAKSSITAESNSFAAKDNSFAADPVAKAIDTAKGFGSAGGGSFLPKSDAFSNVKQKATDSSAAINKSLYDAKGQLASTTSKAQNFAQSSEANSMKTKFEQRLLAAQKQAETKSEAFKAGTFKANDQLNALANVSNRTKDLINQPFPKVAADGSFIPQSPKRPIDLNATQPALQPSNNPLPQINKPNALAANSFGAKPMANDESISQMRSEVEEAKRQIAMLKAQVAAAKQSAATVTQPAQRVAQNTIEGVVLPLDNVSDAFNPRAGSPVANQFQGRPYSPAAAQPQTPTGGASNSFYPATPYGGFGSTAKPKAAVGQVGFNSDNEFQNQVSRASGESASTYSGPLQANRIDSTVSEVLIPSAVLSGSSSFTPGSTTPLR